MFYKILQQSVLFFIATEEYPLVLFFSYATKAEEGVLPIRGLLS